MNAEARIVVRAQFNDTLQKFAQLRRVLNELEQVTDRVNNSLFKLSDSMQKNTAEAQAWSAAVARSATEIGALSNPLNIVAKRLLDLQASEIKAGATTEALSVKLRSNAVALESWGKKLQYNGSILTYSLTLGLGAAFYEATKQEMHYQSALLGLQQSYNQVNGATNSVSAHNQALAQDYATLQKIIIAVSNAYGINRVQVAQNASELSRMGDRSISLASDLALAEKTQRTYNITNAQAVALVTQLRTAYGETSAQTAKDVAALSVIQENSRGTFDVLTQAIQRVAPAAKQAGFSIRELGAMTAVIIQAGYKGGEAGNALSFSLARLLTPTTKATDLFKQLGVNVTSASYQALSGAQRVQLLADKLSNLSGTQKAIAAEVIFGQRQYQRMLPVLEDIANKHGLYNKILNDTANATQNEAFYMRELAKSMATPQAQFDALKTNVENSFRAIAIDLTPAVIGLMRALEGIAQAFANLSPNTQKLIVMSLAFLALIGPIMKIVGVFAILGSYLMRIGALLLGVEEGASAASAAAPLLLRFIGPIGLVMLAFSAFGIRVQDVMLKVVEIVAYAAHTIYALFSWINPWARHSPSLVENVSSGVDQMISDFGRLSFVKGILTDVGATIQRVGNAAAAMSGQSGTPTSLLDARRKVVKAHGDVHTFDSGVAELNKLDRALRIVAKSWDEQSRVVQRAKAAYDAADEKVRAAEAGLKKLQAVQKQLEAQKAAYGDPNGLRSQAASLDAMGHSLMEAGNADLAKRFFDQADALQQQAEKASAVQGQLDSINSQIDAQQAVVDNLTAARDDLLNTYDAEKAKLDAISQGYAEMKAQADALTQALMAMGQAATNALNSLGKTKTSKTDSGVAAFNAAAGSGGVNLDSALKSTSGDLQKWLADFQKHNGINIALPAFFNQFAAAWKKGWDAFGNGSVFQAVFGFGKNWPQWLQVASVAAMLLAGKMIFGRLGMLFTAGFGLLRTFITGGLAGIGSRIAVAVEGLGGLGEIFAAGGLLAPEVVIPVGLALVAVAAAIVLIHRSQSEASKAAQDWVDNFTHINKLNDIKGWTDAATAIEAMSTSTGNMGVNSTSASTSLDSLRTALSKLPLDEQSKAMQDLEATYTALRGKITSFDYNMVQVKNDFGLTQGAAVALADKLGIDLSQSWDKVNALMLVGTTAAGNNTAVIAAASAAYDAFHSATTPVKDQLSALKGLFDALNTSVNGNTTAMDDAQKSVNDLSQNISGGKGGLLGSLSGLTDQAINNRAAMKDVVDKIEQATTNTFQMTGNIADATKAYQGYYNQLKGVLERQGLSASQADALLKAYGLTPAALQAIVGAIPPSLRGLTSLGYKLDDIKGKFKDLNAQAQTLATLLLGGTGSSGKAPTLGTVLWGGLPGVKQPTGHATGGPAYANSLYLVGERGPELLQMGNMAGYIHTAQRTTALLNSMSTQQGGNTYNQEFNITMPVSQVTDPHAVGAYLAAELRGAMR